MNKNQLIGTKNVENANRILKNLLDRTRTESVGIGLFYGRPGLGKTRWGSMVCYDNGYDYIRLESVMTTKHFLKKLLSKLLRTELEVEIKGTKCEIYAEVLDILQSDPENVIFIDEIDYGFKNTEILDVIRDLADRSLTTFILIGMENSKNSIRKMNSHYFDRCNAFYEFNALSINCVNKLLAGLTAINVDDEIIRYLHQKCKGTIRILVKYIEGIETIGARMNKNSLSYNEISKIIDKINIEV